MLINNIRLFLEYELSKSVKECKLGDWVIKIVFVLAFAITASFEGCN